MSKVYKIDKNNKQGKNKKINKQNTITLADRKLVNLLRYRDLKSDFFGSKFKFLRDYRNCDILGFIGNDTVLVFIKRGENILNYVISAETKQYIYDTMLIKIFKKAILNDKYNDFTRTFNYTRNQLYRYEIDLMNDINDWLNDDGTTNSFLRTKDYNILYDVRPRFIVKVRGPK